MTYIVSQQSSENKQLVPSLVIHTTLTTTGRVYKSARKSGPSPVASHRALEIAHIVQPVQPAASLKNSAPSKLTLSRKMTSHAFRVPQRKYPYLHMHNNLALGTRTRLARTISPFWCVDLIMMRSANTFDFYHRSNSLVLDPK